MNTTDINAPTEDDKGQEVFQRIVARFRRRARGHYVISYLALVLTVLVLGGGIYIFAVADELAATRMGASYEELSKITGPFIKDASRSLQGIGETADKVGKDFKDTSSALLSYLNSD